MAEQPAARHERRKSVFYQKKKRLGCIGLGGVSSIRQTGPTCSGVVETRLGYWLRQTKMNNAQTAFCKETR